MALPDKLDTSVGWSFGFEFDNTLITQIEEVTGLKMETDTIELKHNTPDGKYVNRFLPGRPKPGEITMTRGLTDDTSFGDWVNAVRMGDMATARRGGALIVFDYQGEAIARYVLTNCWPKNLEVGPMKAGDTTVLTEKLTLTYDLCEIEKP